MLQTADPAGGDDVVSRIGQEEICAVVQNDLGRLCADLRALSLENAAVAIGSEGQGLSKELLDLCDGELIIPMNPQCESLNAAIAAAIIMWELTKGG